LFITPIRYDPWLQAVLRLIVGAVLGLGEGSVDGAVLGLGVGRVDGCKVGLGVGDAVQIVVVGKAEVPTVLVIAGFQLIQLIFELKNALEPIEMTLSGILIDSNGEP